MHMAAVCTNVHSLLIDLCQMCMGGDGFLCPKQCSEPHLYHERSCTQMWYKSKLEQTYEDLIIYSAISHCKQNMYDQKCFLPYLNKRLADHILFSFVQSEG